MAAKLPTTAVFCFGQSNMSPTCQAIIAAEVGRLTNYRVPVFGNNFGGQPLSYWIAGTTGAYTRATPYNQDLAFLKGHKFQKLILCRFHGESDASGILPATYQEKLEAHRQFILADMGVPGAVIETVSALPWDTDGAAAGYGNGGVGDQIRAAITAQAAVEGGLVYDTAGLARSDTVHVNQTLIVSTLAVELAARCYTQINA